MIPGAHPITLGGETLWLLPDRGLLWPAQDALLVADIHFGKAQIFRNHGIAVPAGADDRDRERIGTLLRQTGATRLFVLGDFLHAALHAAGDDIHAIEQWCEDLAPVGISVVAGNHDRHVLRQWQPSFAWYTGTLRVGSLTLAHAAEDDPTAAADGVVLSGHFHPVWRARRGRLHRLRIPVFWRNASGLVLPAFGSLTGGQLIRPEPTDQLFVAADDAVLRVPSASMVI